MNGCSLHLHHYGCRLNADSFLGIEAKFVKITWIWNNSVATRSQRDLSDQSISLKACSVNLIKTGRVSMETLVHWVHALKCRRNHSLRWYFESFFNKSISWSNPNDTEDQQGRFGNHMEWRTSFPRELVLRQKCHRLMRMKFPWRVLRFRSQLARIRVFLSEETKNRLEFLGSCVFGFHGSGVFMRDISKNSAEDWWQPEQRLFRAQLVGRGKGLEKRERAKTGYKVALMELTQINPKCFELRLLAPGYIEGLLTSPQLWVIPNRGRESSRETFLSEELASH